MVYSGELENSPLDAVVLGKSKIAMEISTGYVSHHMLHTQISCWNTELCVALKLYD